MESKVVRSVLSIWSWLVLGALVLMFTPIVAVVRLVTMPFDKGAYAAGYVFRKLTPIHSALSPLWKFSTSGSLPDDMRRPYVAVANHESFVDILLISHLPTEFKWLSKAEIMRIPVRRLDDAAGTRHPARTRRHDIRASGSRSST